MTVHGTNDVRVENNVTYNTVGHCFFLEDAVEHGNQFIHNLGDADQVPSRRQTLCSDKPRSGRIGGARSDAAGQTAKDILIPSDNTASTFWITNPDNIYRDNVAAGSEAIGFWFALPQHPTGAFLTSRAASNIWPRRTTVREFSGNTAHSNFDGFMFDRGPQPDGTFSVGGAGHIAFANPADPNSPGGVGRSRITPATRTAMAPSGAAASMHLFTNLKLADNAIGFTHAARRCRSRPLYVPGRRLAVRGRERQHRQSQHAGGNRLRPQPAERQSPDFPIRGYEYYDYRHDVVNTTFVNFPPNATRDAGAISYLLFTSFGMSTENSVEGATFVNAKPVDFPAVERRWASDFGTRHAYRSATIHDLDGSVGGVPNSYIVIDNGIASDEAGLPDQGELGCGRLQGDMGRFNIGGNFDDFGRRRHHRSGHAQPQRQAVRI